MTNEKGLIATVEIDGMDYEITYNLWIWRSRDHTEKTERIITITNSEPKLDEENEDEAIEKLWRNHE